MQRKNEYLGYLIDPSFQWVHRVFVLLFEDNAHQIRVIEYILEAVETKNINVMIDGKTFLFNQ